MLNLWLSVGLAVSTLALVTVLAWYWLIWKLPNPEGVSQ